ncbi:MAG TPA: hypothetical protein VJN42_05195 [Candidatus Acidoferrum sp.]|nr:hypothetical protein [Candidatus Acidoferrum sp.]
MKTDTRKRRSLIFLMSCLVGATLWSAGLLAQDQGWQIVRADYGFKNQRNDVTDILRDLISRGGVNGRVAVNNQTMGGDPAIGKDKSLHILARNRDQQREFDFREGSFIDVAQFSVPRADVGDWDRDRVRDRDRGRDFDDRDRGGTGDLSILRGYYGIQGRTANVTDLLRSQIRDGVLSLNVNNENLGGDPAIGANKVLIVIYRFRGQEQAAAVWEGNRLTIP